MSVIDQMSEFLLLQAKITLVELRRQEMETYINQLGLKIGAYSTSDFCCIQCLLLDAPKIRCLNCSFFQAKITRVLNRQLLIDLMASHTVLYIPVHWAPKFYPMSR